MMHHSQPADVSSTSVQHLRQHMVPRDVTRAAAFLASHPAADGRGIIVGVLDTGIDPSVRGLRSTPDGRRKIVGCVDATGSGDVTMSSVPAPSPIPIPSSTSVSPPSSAASVEHEHGHEHEHEQDSVANTTLNANSNLNLNSTSSSDSNADPWVVQVAALPGACGQVRVPAAWGAQADPASWRAGFVLAQRLFPRDHMATLLDERKRLRALELSAVLAVAGDAGDATAALIDALGDDGPVVTVVAFRDATDGEWRVAVSTESGGGMLQSALLRPFEASGDVSFFSAQERLAFSVNVWDDGAVVEVVTTAGSHGTHVAGIVAAHFPDEPSLNGVAPGAQLVSIKIGDSRLGSMETGTGLVRGLIAAKRLGCHVLNLSYGESTTLPGTGRVHDLLQELVLEHNVVFVSSAGNNGPGISSVGAPGGTSDCVISVGAAVTPAMADAAYSQPSLPGRTMLYTWSSRGPAADGLIGVTVCAPGGAITTVPAYQMQSAQLMNGTSMSSPNCAGSIALLLSAMRADGFAWTQPFVAEMLRASSSLSPFGSTARVSVEHGYGMIDVVAAHEYYRDCAAASPAGGPSRPRVTARVGAAGSAGAGLYLREPSAFAEHKYEETVEVKVEWPKSAPRDAVIAYDEMLQLTCDDARIVLPRALALSSGGRNFPVVVMADRYPAGEVSVTEIRGVAGDGVGPVVFRLPVTVARPAIVSGGRTFEVPAVRLERGAVARKLFAVPACASEAEVRLHYHSGPVKQRFAFHATQLLPQEVPGDGAHWSLLSPGSIKSYRFAVTGGRTLEIAYAPFWTAPDPVSVSMSVTWYGLSGPDAISLAPGALSTPVRVLAGLVAETCSPSVKLTAVRTVLQPTGVKPVLRRADRDQFPGRPLILEQTLSYAFQLGADASCLLRVPQLSAQLYESQVEAQMWSIYCESGRMMHWGDFRPEGKSLPAGRYVARLQLRHESPAVMKRLARMPVYLERKLASEVTLPVYRTAAASVVGSPAGSPFAMRHGELAVVHVGSLQLDAAPPAGIANGDELVGNMYLYPSRGDDRDVAPHGIPVSYTLTSAAAAASPAVVVAAAPAAAADATVDQLRADVDRMLASFVGGAPAPTTAVDADAAAAAATDAPAAAASAAEPPATAAAAARAVISLLGARAAAHVTGQDDQRGEVVRLQKTLDRLGGGGLTAGREARAVARSHLRAGEVVAALRLATKEFDGGTAGAEAFDLARAALAAAGAAVLEPLVLEAERKQLLAMN